MGNLNLEKLRNKLLELNNNKFNIKTGVYGNINKCYFISFAELYQLLILPSEIEHNEIKTIDNIYDVETLSFDEIDTAKEVLDFIKYNEKKIIKAINDSIERFCNEK